MEKHIERYSLQQNGPTWLVLDRETGRTVERADSVAWANAWRNGANFADLVGGGLLELVAENGTACVRRKRGHETILYNPDVHLARAYVLGSRHVLAMKHGGQLENETE